MPTLVLPTRFVCQGQIKPVIIRHTIAVPLGVVKQGLPIYLIFAARKSNGITRIIYKCSTQRPFFAQLIQTHYRNIVCTVLTGIEPSTIIYLFKLPFALGQCIAYPPVKPSFYFAQEKFHAISPTLTKQQIAFQIPVGL